jgi:predicted AAA+ superfamily ATPase
MVKKNYKRLIQPSRNSSFFLFGARGTGKSTFIENQFKMKNPFTLNLLDPEIEDYYARVPKRFENELLALKKKPDWVVVDEVQKIPRLLDMIHLLIERHNYKFILTGSSARKLKRGGANLLAGRAFVNELFPLTPNELSSDFELVDYLHWGGLPKIMSFKNTKDKKNFLLSYILTYLNEEIRMEQIVRKLDPFRVFLEVAAQASSKIINHKKISNEIGVDTKTIQSYFQILEDTLLGFYLPAFHESVRKSQKINPKFYLFDTGVKKALENSLEQIPTPRTSVFGELFEHMVILNIHRLNKYYNHNYKLSYFSTKNNAEIDLILSKNRRHKLIEIKSSEHIDEAEVTALARIAKDFPGEKEIFYLSQDPHALKIEGVQCLHWRKFLEKK